MQHRRQKFTPADDRDFGIAMGRLTMANELADTPSVSRADQGPETRKRLETLRLLACAMVPAAIHAHQ